MILMNRLMSAASLCGPISGVTPDLGAGGILLCVGTAPSDLEVEAMTAANYAASAVVVAGKSVTLNMTGMTAGYVQASPFTTFISGLLPSAASTKVGTLNWGIILSKGQPVFVDVGLPNSGAVIQVDVVSVGVGTVVQLLSCGFKFGRK